MTVMYIRVKKDGFIYDYNEILAKNPGCEVITEQEAFPERFVPAHVADRIMPPESVLEPKGRASKKGKDASPRKAALDLTTADIPEPPVYTAPELAADASRGLLA